MGFDGFTRLHRISSGDALDRRRLVELFNQATERANDIVHHSFGDEILSRVDFTQHCYQEFWYNKDTDLHYDIPDSPGCLPGSVIPVRNDDSFTYGELAWSLRGVAASTSSIMIMAWPVFNSKALWSGEDFVMIRCISEYPASGSLLDPEADKVAGLSFTNGDPISLGGVCSFSGYNGRMLSGVLVHSIGRFRIQNVQLSIRVRAR